MKMKYLISTAVAAVIASSAAMADGFPERPINLIAPFNAGGGTDLLLRGLAPHFAEAIGSEVFVSNMAGGSGTVAGANMSMVRPAPVR